MFRRITRLIRAYRESIVSLVLLPAFFLGTMPHTACICADGHREEFCKAALCRAINNGSITSNCCGCSCCKNSGAQQQRSCCRAKNCESKSRSQAPANGVAAKTGSCCHPFVEAPAPATNASNADLSSHLTLVSTIDLPQTSVGVDELQPTLDRSSFCTPPPLDTVIVFLHLTI